MSLRKKTLSGVVWTIVDTFVLKGLSFVASIYLARLLGPKEFGLIGMISIFIAIGNTLVDSGLSSSLIRTKNADNVDFSTVFYLNLGLSTAVYIVLFFIAPFVADFYQQDSLTDMMRIYCISFIITAFSAVQLARLNTEMNFKKIAMLNMPATLIGIFAGLCFGYYGFGAWSIVYMFLINQIIRSILLWFSSSWRPSFIFSKEKAKFHYVFGYKLMLSQLLNTSFTYIYNVVIGRFYPVRTLGHYERARSFTDYPSSVLTGVISKVTFPLLSKIQDDVEKVAQIYRKLLKLMFFVTAPLMLGLSALAKPLFMIFLGDQWIPSISFFQILCLAFMFYPIHAYNLNVFKVFGRSDLFLKLEVIKKILIVISILITFQFGILGLVWSSVVTSVVGLFINTYYSKDIINYSTKQQIIDMIPTFLIAGCMFVLIKLVVFYLSDFSYTIQLVSGLFIGICFYMGVNFVLKIDSFKFALDIIKKRKI